MALERNSNSEPKITYARNPEGKLVHIDTVPNGRNCNCVCEGCGKPLIARQGDVNQHHFAHKGGNIRDCYDKTLHSLAEQIIKENKKVYSPWYEGEFISHKSELLSFVDVEVEQRNDFSDLQPDLVGVTEEGKRIHIEIRNTHKVDSSKESKLRDRKQICMEIDVSKQSLDDLKDFLLTKDEERNWVNHPEYEEEDRKAREAAYEQEEANGEMSESDMLKTIKWMSELAVKTKAYDFDEEERYYDRPTSAPTNYQTTEITEPAMEIEPPTIVPNKALDPILEKLRKERIVQDSNGKTYYVDLCQQTYDGKYIVARVFDENYKTSHQAAHIVLINSLGTISYDFGNESGENLYSWRYTYAKRFK